MCISVFDEEYGWRNYMADALRGQKFWKAAIIIGLVWGIWHVPLILLGHNYPLHPVAGAGMMCICVILLGTLELWSVLKTCSVIPAAIMHGTLNAISGAVLFWVLGGSDLTVGMPGLSGMIAMVIVITMIWLYDRKHGRDYNERNTSVDYHSGDRLDTVQRRSLLIYLQTDDSPKCRV